MLCLRSALSAWPSGGPPLAGDAWVHPELAALRDYWLSKCGARRMPARSAIDPLEMKRWLGHLVLHEVIDGGQIGRESCRERGCQYVSISVVAGSIKKKT